MEQMKEVEREKLFDKIRGLLDTTVERGASEAEAQSAANLAMKLLTKHKLDLAEVRESETQQEAYVIDLYPMGVKKLQPFHYLVALMEGCSTVCWCRMLMYDKDRVFILIGKANDIATAKSMYEYLRGVVEREGQLAIVGMPWGNGYRAQYHVSFRLGMCQRIAARLVHEFNVERQKSNKVNTLVRTTEEELKTIVSQAFPKTRKSEKPTVEEKALKDGHYRGGFIPLHSNKSLEEKRG